MRNKTVLFAVLVATVTLFASFSLYAQPMQEVIPPATASLTKGYQVSPDFIKTINLPPETGYANTPASRGGDGMINVATCWTDIPREVVEVTKEDNAFMGATVGLGDGILTGISRGISGAYQVATFAIPPYDDPIMQPEYKVNRPQQEGLKIDVLKW